MPQSQISGITRLATDSHGVESYRLSMSVTGGTDATIPIMISSKNRFSGVVIHDYVVSGGGYPTILNVNSTGTSPVMNVTFSVASATADVTLDVHIREQ